MWYDMPSCGALYCICSSRAGSVAASCSKLGQARERWQRVAQSRCETQGKNPTTPPMSRYCAIRIRIRIPAHMYYITTRHTAPRPFLVELSTPRTQNKKGPRAACEETLILHGLGRV